MNVERGQCTKCTKFGELIPYTTWCSKCYTSTSVKMYKETPTGLVCELVQNPKAELMCGMACHAAGECVIVDIKECEKLREELILTKIQLLEYQQKEETERHKKKQRKEMEMLVEQFHSLTV